MRKISYEVKFFIYKFRLVIGLFLIIALLIIAPLLIIYIDNPMIVLVVVPLIVLAIIGIVFFIMGYWKPKKKEYPDN